MINQFDDQPSSFVSDEFIQQMTDKYPQLDVGAEIGNIRTWLNSNPKRRHIPASMEKFIVMWLDYSSVNKG